MGYRVNEIFFSLQGEGVRAGTANVFVRFSGCNLTCRREVEGFDCDTEFTSGVTFATANQLLETIAKVGGNCKNIIWTGGEPSLQLDEVLVARAKEAGYYQAIETNGTNELVDGLDWITVSPKTAEHTLRQPSCDEVKYVRNILQGIPKPSIAARYHLISPAFEPGGELSPATLKHCIQLVKDHPAWRLSMQLHKFWGVR